MIPDSVSTPQSPHWKQVLSSSFRQVYDLLKYCEVEHAFPEICIQTDFSFRVTRYYASLIEKGNPQDPLLLQVLPQYQELIDVAGYSKDAVGDLHAMPIPALIHKYANRVLLTLTAACAIHCRYCFRRHFPNQDCTIDLSAQSEQIKYLSSHSQINEVILSGGDPLMLDDQKLSQLIQHLNQIPHIKLLRIHSRMISVLPQRIDMDLIHTLSEFNGQVVLVTHINHPNELSEFNRPGLELLREHGISLLNQSVLLQGINDDAELLSELSYRLFSFHILPYYLHKLDKVQGAAHFDLNQKQVCQIYKSVQKKLPGYLLPRLVEENPGENSKTAIHCD